ncbi:MAG: protein kinase [Kiritimatiellae bacterium]|nr:protein kinase [Kiritimatiellia bacterium]
MATRPARKARRGGARSRRKPVRSKSGRRRGRPARPQATAGRSLAGITQVIELPDHTRVVIVLPDRVTEPVFESDERAALPPSGVLKVAGERKYHLTRVIARGGMGLVCEARDLKSDRTVAMKLLMRRSEHYGEDHLRFMHEGRLTAQLEHPNIVPVHELGNDAAGNDFYTMKFVRGVTLTDVLMDIRKGRKDVIQRYSLRDLLTVFQKTCDAVAFAHSRGVIHRDLKPGNIMIGDFGEVLVLDWGLAKVIGRRDEPEKTGGGRWRTVDEDLPLAEGEIPTIAIQTDKLGGGLYSESGKIIGTPSFMSPEHTRGGGAAVDQRSDIYSLGAILYSILTLEVPVKGRTIKEVLRKIVAGEILPPVRCNEAAGTRRRALPHCPDGQVPPVLSEIAMRALAADPAERYQTVEDLQQDIEDFQDGLIWHLVIEEDFSDPGAFESRWEVMGGQCEVRDNELRVFGGEPQIVLLKRELPVDVRIEFECREEGIYLNDIGCILSAVPSDRTWDTSISGYALKYGAYTNSFNVVTRLDRKIWSEQASPLASGQKYLVRAERIGPRLRLMVNNRVVADVTDPDPLIGSHRTVAGLLGWIADTFYTRIRVYTLGTPWQSDILDMAERQLQKSRCATARDLFHEALDSFPDAERLERAERGYAAAELRQHVMENLPAWRAALADAWPGVGVRLGLDKDGLTVDIPRSAGVSDLGPLKDLPVAVLRCSLNEIESLDPLRGMPLVSLDCAANRIASLEPLRGMKLRTLNCGINRVSSLDPLRDMPLTSLSCGENPLKDGLEALRGMQVTWLQCGCCGVESLEPLASMPLVMLFCDANRIPDLQPLRGMHLTELSCSYNRIRDLAPLRGMALNDLNCAGNEVESIEPLKGMPLSTFKGHCNRITSIEPLKGMPLTTLMCGGNLLRDIGPFIKKPPKNFQFDCDSIPPRELEWISATWARDFRFARYVKEVDVLLALRRGDWQGLRNMATEFRGHRYLFVPRFLGWAEARDLCRQAGGHLVVIRSHEENEFLAGFFPFGGSWYWIGLSTTGGQPAWVTGEPFEFSAFIDELHARRTGPKICRGTNWFYDMASDARNTFVIEWDA